MDSYLPEKGYKRVLVLAVYVIGGGLLFLLAVRYLLGALLPLLLAWGTAVLLRPMAEAIGKKTGMTRRAAGFAALFFLLLLLGAGMVWLVLSIISQAGDLLAMLSENADSLSKEMWELIDQVLSRLPISDEGERAAIEEAVRGAVGDAASGMLSRLTAAIPGWVGAVLSSIPGVMLFATVYVVSAFTLCTRYEQTVAGLNRYLPSGARRLIATLKQQLTKLGFSYLRAALILLAVTFFELYLGFRLLGLPYAVLLAAVIALIDLLPVLGIGTVLLPWALFCLLTQRFRLGVGLLIVFLVISLVRQLLEPRIVGKSIGLSPLLTLTSMYAGWYLFGVAGLLLFPAGATLAVKVIAYGTGAKQKENDVL